MQPAHARLRTPLRQALNAAHGLLILTLLGVFIYFAVPYIRAAARPRPVEIPHTMEAVDWASPNSSKYCVACHRDTGVAMALRDVEHGHPQNVPLNDAQVAAVAHLGTTAGPADTLICMSCHKLGSEYPHMLADTLRDGQFCEHCHPGHYARGTPHDLRQSAPLEVNRAGQNVLEGGPCSACHLAHRYARDFEPSPLDPDGRCITCHADYRVAAHHARKTMEHPDSHCIACHDPHDMSQGEFLKATGPDLCVGCHTDYAAGPAAGMHPVGPIAQAIPASLVAGGATVTGDAHQLDCLVCHSPHKASYGQLLVANPDTNDLCLSCHEHALVHGNGGVLPRHGASPVLSEAQRTVVADWGTRTGPGGELLCVSCHKVHGGQRDGNLLAFKLRYGDTCLECHPQQTTIVGSTHDLRTNLPRLENRIGLTAAAAGECGACHLAHSYAQPVAPTAGDRTGRCMTCHQDGGCAEGRLAGAPDHPDTTCRDCHNPHDPTHANFLARPEFELCSGCHAEQARLVGGPHDISVDTPAWPAAARDAGGKCLPCHVAHGGADPDLLRVRETQVVNRHDGACLGCHPETAWQANTSIAALHPRGVTSDHPRVDAALVPTDEEGRKQLGCQTCHNPHGPAQPTYLARTIDGSTGQSLCLGCHKDVEYIRYTGHSADKLKAAGFDSDSCRPCHAMHAAPEATWGQVLSPRFLEAACNVAGTEIAGCVPCLACHYPSGPAPARAIATHPEKIMLNVTPPDAPGYLPLFNLTGHVDPQGQVMCRTCHLSHGRLDLLKRVAENQQLTPDEQKALNIQVRSFVPPNVCTDCHGPDARNFFLYFHDAPWRDKTQPKLGSPQGR